jgi:hypothetical protein
VLFFGPDGWVCFFFFRGIGFTASKGSLSAMKVPTVKELESFKGTVPDFAEDAKNLVIDSCKALNIMAAVDIRTSVTQPKAMMLFDEESYDETWDDTFPNGGNIRIRSQGGSRVSYDIPDINILVIRNDDTIRESFTDVLCSEGGRDFILNGTKVCTQNNDITISFRSIDDMLMNINLYLEGDIAYTVKVKDTAIGAKILIKFKTDKILFFPFADTDVNAEVKNRLEVTPLTISVYDDADELKHTFADVPLGDIFTLHLVDIP